MKKKTLFSLGTLFCLLLCTTAVFGQPETGLLADPSPLIGTTLPELINRYGAPKQVYAVRGIAAWQDDVVFVYDNGEFFIFGNRVWQVKVSAAFNIKDGDQKAAVTRTLGEGRDFDGYTLYQLPGKAWPLMLRINWGSSGRAAGIFVYRSDF